jgi:hypothetical protein
VIDDHLALQLVPGTRIGPFALGMTRDHVPAEAARIGELVRGIQKVRGESPIL